MRRGEMVIEHQALELPTSHKKVKLDPTITRDGNRILLDGEEIERSMEPIHGIAMDLGTTTIVLRLINLETGEIIAHASFENLRYFLRITSPFTFPRLLSALTQQGYPLHVTLLPPFSMES